MSDIKKVIGNVFEEIATGLETGAFGTRPRIAVTTLGSEHGLDNVVKGAELAQSRDKSVEYCIIGPEVKTSLKQYVVANEDEGYKKMESLLDSGEIDGCVTMHYSFPIGVSTVGRVVTPAAAKEMIIATTTGTSSAHRVEGMIKNTIYGIATAKSLGIEKPTVGIANIEGARQVEKILIELKESGYDFEFATSQRADGGAVMRGNDLLMATPDVMVVDSLTGNLFMKVFSAFNTGGDYEAQGYGYGPGVGEDYDRRILILSRASGAPVVANSLKYAYEIAVGEVNELARKEYGKAKEANLDALLNKLKEKKETSQSEEVKAPEKEIVTAQIAGVDIMDLEDATKELWKRGIYAESGMGCTGPIVLVNTDKKLQAEEVLKEVGLLS